MPGTDKNKYNAGPFTITIVKAIAPDPNPDDGNGGNDASEVLVQNTSNDFTGYAQPEVQYSYNGQVIGSNTATTGSLAPGQSQNVWVGVNADQYQGDLTGKYVEAQLITLWFSTAMDQSGERLQLAH